MDEVKNMMLSFAEDIIEYQRLGGDMDRLDATKMYDLLDGREPSVDTEYNEHDVLDNLVGYDEDKLNSYYYLCYGYLSFHLDKGYLDYIFTRMKSKVNDFGKLSLKDKYTYLRHGYRLLSFKHNPNGIHKYDRIKDSQRHHIQCLMQ